MNADVVALDQPYFYNRLGATNVSGMIFALRRDVVDSQSGAPIGAGGVAGQVRLRTDKRPRPLVLRVNAGDCLSVKFTNLLSVAPVPVYEKLSNSWVTKQPATRAASFHVTGMQPVGSIVSDASNVGINSPTGLAAPGAAQTYTFFAQHEGTFLAYSAGAQTGGEGDGGSISAGLFGAVQVEPAGAEWYRSQVTAADMELATRRDSNGQLMKTADGHPLIDYAAVYPANATYADGTTIPAGTPILKMTDGTGNIVHSDLNAIITGPGAGRFPTGIYRPNPVYPDREQPFREFTVIFHDEIVAEQAFPEFRDPVLGYTLQGVGDYFGINYGTGGVGAEILANRKGVGPTKNCVDCKFEEFFLSSWAGGDPAMVVDNPANSGFEATKAFYPDDPSNVHHSYLNDHVKIRNLHAGPKEIHVFHLHAHQWLHSPESDNSAYLDSQSIGPGAGFSYEIAHNGGGNRNKTVGDSIFHCHFYPHFAQGMWGLWRNHDVFESGTKLDAQGRPAPGSRALPDGEIAVGTPIPAVVPLPTLAMAPIPEAQVSIDASTGKINVQGSGNAGYPFFMADAAVPGHRPPTPPLSIVNDGGLPRHVITGGQADQVLNRHDMMKTLTAVNAVQVPEAGSPLEQAAMNFHSQRHHASYKPDGSGGDFVLNGLPPKPGAPFADPCVDDNGVATGVPVTYKAADIQLDIKLNKAGWHHPQSRMLALWGDVPAYLSGAKAPEPFFFRANSKSCIDFYYTNLIPNVYELDDFEVRTPTDIIGQHIHLVKFDVMASDGGGNGWNYENGAFSFQEVQERINAINGVGGSWNGAPGQLVAQPHPEAALNQWGSTLGARTIVERWYADPTLNLQGQDRTLRTVFTHDHFGPSTHQQAGLYGGLVIEPEGSQWRHPQSGVMMGTRTDGGPTSWNADIITGKGGADSYREFLLEFADFQLAYKAGGGMDSAGNAKPDPANAIGPPARRLYPEVPLAVMNAPALVCPGNVPPPCPETISTADVGTVSVNYRNEPLGYRLRDPKLSSTISDSSGYSYPISAQAAGFAGDLSYAFSSNVTRADPLMNVQPTYYPAMPGAQPGDPYTPLLRAYEGDRVQVRVMVGANEEGHNFSVNGIKWLNEPSVANSGYRNSQAMGISEHFEFLAERMDETGKNPFTDHIWRAGAATDDLWDGSWGLMRIYDKAMTANKKLDLLTLPNNPTGTTPSVFGTRAVKQICPATAPVKTYNVTAVTAKQALPGGTLVYNARGGLNDPTAILFVQNKDLDATGKFKLNVNGKPKVPVEPLILRAAAGDCIVVNLTNKLPASLGDLPGTNWLPAVVDGFNANQLVPSSYVGLHPQLVDYYMAAGADGMNVGLNVSGTAAPGGTISYRWYAGDVEIQGGKTAVYTPIEFGATNLMPSDPIKQPSKGAIGALIIEPQGSTWLEDADDATAVRNTRDSATITKADGSKFREFVVLFQDDVALRYANNNPVPIVAGVEDAIDSGHKAVNYKTEPMWLRASYEPDSPLSGWGGCIGTGPCLENRAYDFSDVLRNRQVGDAPETPIFHVAAGMPVRYRVLQPGGHNRGHDFELHGHVWQEEPYANNSTTIGDNPLSEWQGVLNGHGPSNHFDAVLANGAGGAFAIPGDYLYRDQQSFSFDGGIWGVMRVK